jgi:hypothetical protein
MSNFTPDGNFYLCSMVKFKETVRVILCLAHTRTKGITVIRQNGRGFAARNPVCVLCDVERGVELALAQLKEREQYRHSHECVLCGTAYWCDYGRDCEIPEGEKIGCAMCQGDDPAICAEWEKRKVA